MKLSDTNGDPLQGDFSIAITDAYVVPYDEWELNVENYLLMLSDLDRPIHRKEDLRRSRGNRILEKLRALRFGRGIPASQK